LLSNSTVDIYTCYWQDKLRDALDASVVGHEETKKARVRVRARVMPLLSVMKRPKRLKSRHYS